MKTLSEFLCFSLPVDGSSNAQEKSGHVNSVWAVCVCSFYLVRHFNEWKALSVYQEETMYMNIWKMVI